MSDLTAEEQTHVRTALRFLFQRCGGWGQLAKVLGYGPTRAKQVAYGRTVSPTMAFRVARLACVNVDDVLSGRYPDPRACPHCGQVPGAKEAQSA